MTINILGQEDNNLKNKKLISYFTFYMNSNSRQMDKENT